MYNLPTGNLRYLARISFATAQSIAFSSDLFRGNASRLMGRIVYKACPHQSFLHLPVKYEFFHLEAFEIFVDLTEPCPDEKRKKGSPISISFFSISLLLT
jgi:hypothetical protein